MEVLKYLLVIVAGYLLGSISVSVCLSVGMGRDVRKEGSGNAGATNMARVFGMKAGVITLLGDMVKAALAVLLVTSCVIPILVLAFFVWITKLILGINLDLPRKKL